MEGLDPADVASAVRDFIQGRAPGGNPAFLPSTAELAQQARRVRDARIAQEMRDAPRLPPPPSVNETLTPEQRAERAARIAEVVAELRNVVTIGER